MTRVEKRIINRAGVDVELTHKAFQLPGLYDPQNTASSINPKGLKREFYKIPAKKPTKQQITSEKDTTSNVSQFSAAALAAGDDVSNNQLLQDHDFYIPEEDVGEDNTDTYDKVRKLIFGQSLRQSITRLESKNINFNDIVDVDDEAFENHVTENLAARFGEGDYFRIFILLMIIANSIVIGIQTDETLARTATTTFALLDDIFITIFIMEVLLKWYYGFVSFWKSGWNIFDVVIIVAALSGPSLSFLSNSRILRILRVLRAFRSLRSISALTGLQTVVKTVLRSIPDMANIAFLLLIVMFIFAIVGVTLFKEHDEYHFGDLGSTMFTLFIFVTQDGWTDIFDELEAQGQFIPAAIYSVVFITIGSFIFANVISAVVVANLETTYEQLRKAHRLKYRELKTAAQSTQGQKQFQRPVVNVPAGTDRVWRGQIPLEVPDFDKIPKSKLENYFLILSIIEENLKEYLSLKESLQEILMEVKLLNANAPAMDEEGDEGEEEEEGNVEDEGDVLSRFIRKGKM